MNISEYYKEMRDKYGFDEGSSVPEGIEKVRKVIIKEVNKQLAETDYKDIELFEHDRAGVHNWCLIGLRNKTSRADIYDAHNDLEGKIMEIVVDLNEKYGVREKVYVARYRKE